MLLWIVVYAVVAAVIVALRRGSRLKTAVVLLLLGYIIDFWLGIPVMKRVALQEWRGTPPLPSGYLQGLDKLTALVLARVPFVVLSAAGLAILALYPRLFHSKREGTPVTGPSQPSISEKKQVEGLDDGHR
jgi:biotin transporter BioY